MVDDNLKEYVDNNIFTASARDVLEMYGRSLNDYRPILIRCAIQNPQQKTEEDKKLNAQAFLRERGLEMLAKRALDNNCEFVTDLVVTHIVLDYFDAMQFIGTGLIEEE